MKRLLVSALLTTGLFFSGPAGLLAQAGTLGKGYVNAQDLSNSLGVSYRWYPMQKMVVLSKGTQIMRLIIDKNEAIVDNKPVALPGAPVLKDGAVFVPAKALLQTFGGSGSAPVKATAATPPSPTPPKVLTQPQQKPPPRPPIEEIDPETPAEEDDEPPNVPATEPEILQAKPPKVVPPPAIITTPPNEDEESILTSVRHSRRDDHTRVVFEFDGPISHTLEKSGKNKLKVKISGCKNVFPTKKSNPVGRDIVSMSFNSGADKKGLVVSFDVPEGAAQPTIETVANPYRMVLSFKATPAALAATASGSAVIATAPVQVKVATATEKLPKPGTASPTSVLAQGSASGTETIPSLQTPKPPTVAPSGPEPIPEITIDVPLASLSRSMFSGRLIVIDPGHGGSDTGAQMLGLPNEKEITLAISQRIRTYLRQIGFQVLLLRKADIDMSPAERSSMVNRSSGDLFISIHTGASQDETLQGPVCFTYDTTGAGFDLEYPGKLSPQLTYNDWAKNYRFDLARFLATRVSAQLNRALSYPDRGVKGLPFLPLRFLTIPGILVEVGYLTNSAESRKLAAKGYQDAIARCVANGVTEFFNSIKVNQE